MREGERPDLGRSKIEEVLPSPFGLLDSADVLRGRTLLLGGDVLRRALAVPPHVLDPLAEQAVTHDVLCLDLGLKLHDLPVERLKP